MNEPKELRLLIIVMEDPEGKVHLVEDLDDPPPRVDFTFDLSMRRENCEAANDDEAK